jgi:hypothetical protein
VAQTEGRSKINGDIWSWSSKLMKSKYADENAH